MKITDAQVHIWAKNSPERPWPQHGRAKPHRDTAFSHDDLLREMDEAGVARAIIVPPSWEGERNDLALDACRKHPDRFAIMGRIAPDPANLPALETWRNQPGMMGLRFTYRPDHQGPDDGSIGLAVARGGTRGPSADDLLRRAGDEPSGAWPNGFRD